MPNLKEQIEKVKIIKEDIAQNIEKAGVYVPDDAPLLSIESGLDRPFGLPEYIMQMDDGKSFDVSRLHGGDYTVYFSWIDAETGKPQYIRQVVIQGQKLELPQAMLDSISAVYVKENFGYNPRLKFSYISSSADDNQYTMYNYDSNLEYGIQENLIIQAEYDIIDINRDHMSLAQDTDPLFYMRILPTNSFSRPKIFFNLISSVNVVLPTGSSLYLLIDNTFVKTIPLNARYAANETAGVTVDLYSTIIAANWENNEHLVEVRIPTSIQKYFTHIYFGMPGLSNLTQYTNGIYRSSDASVEIKEDPFYASQIEAIYILPANKNKRQIHFHNFALNYMTNLDTIIFPEGIWTDSDYFMTNSKNLQYMSVLKQWTDLDNAAGVWLQPKAYAQRAFNNTGAKFLQMKSFITLYEGFLNNSKSLEVLPKNIMIFAIVGFRASLVGNFDKCISLRTFPKITYYPLPVRDFPVNIVRINELCRDNLLISSFDTDFTTLFDNVEYVNAIFVRCLNLIEPPVLPAAIDVIEDDCFRGCIRLKTLNPLSENLKRIGYGFLFGCLSFESLPYLPEGIMQIGDSFCEDCVKLKNILNFPKSLAYIGHNFLSYCESLEELPPFHQNLVEIGTGFLIGCKNLKTVHLERLNLRNGQPIVPNDAFRDCPALENIYVGIGQKAAYVARFPGIMPDIFKEVYIKKYKVAFHWLISDYVPRFNAAMLTPRSFVVEVFEGDTLSIPQEYTPHTMYATATHPIVRYTSDSGNINQLTVTGVTRDLVIQAEYSWYLVDNNFCPGVFFLISNEGGYNYKFEVKLSAFSLPSPETDYADWLPTYYRTTFCSHQRYSHYALDFSKLELGDIDYYVSPAAFITKKGSYGGLGKGSQGTPDDEFHSINAIADAVKLYNKAKKETEYGFPGNSLTRAQYMKECYSVVYLRDWGILENTTAAVPNHGVIFPYVLTRISPSMVERDRSTPVILGIRMSKGPNFSYEQYPAKLSANRYFSLGTLANRTYTNTVGKNTTEIAPNSMFLPGIGMYVNEANYEPGTGAKHDVLKAVLGCYLSATLILNNKSFAHLTEMRFVLINFKNAAGEEIIRSLQVGNDVFYRGYYEYIPSMGLENRREDIIECSVNGNTINDVDVRVIDGGDLAPTNFLRETKIKYIPALTVRILGDNFAMNSTAEVLSPIARLEEVGHSFCAGTNLTNMTALPNTLVKIGDNFCAACKLLEYVVIPKSIRSIGINFLNGCTLLMKVYLVGVSPNIVPLVSFYGIPHTAQIYVSSGDITNYKNRFKDLASQFVIA